MKPSAPHIAGIGHVAFDWMFLIEGFPKPDTKITAAADHVQLGGPVPIALFAATQQGVRASWIGSVGGDPAGHAVQLGFAAAAIDLSASRVVAAAVTGVSQIWVEIQNGRRTIVHRPTTAPPLMADEAAAALEQIGDVDWLHLDAWSGHRAGALAAAQRIRARGGRVSVDLGEPKEAVDDLIAAATVVVAPARTARALTGQPPSRAVGALQARGPRLAVVTLGAGGAVASTGRRLYRQPAPWIDVADTTGAGDIFCGTLIARLALGDDDQTALQCAVDTAARSCGQIGNGTRLPALGIP